MKTIDKGKIPRHVAIIMDGNGRWATKHNRPRIFGHHRGADRVRDTIEASIEMGVETLTLYAFSEENWGRPREEVDGLFGLLSTYLKREVDKLVKEGVRLRAIGSLEKLPRDCFELIDHAQRSTAHGTKLQLILALSYGGRSDIVSSCQKIAQMALDGKIGIDEIDQELFANNLSTKGMGDPDLLIRTSGELRVSNFLLWQLAYSEFYFTNTLWPDFSKDEFRLAIKSYQSRQRRFGKVSGEPHQPSVAAVSSITL